MKPLLARIGLPQAIGLYVDDREVFLSQVVSTPLGAVEIDRCQAAATADSLPEVLAELLATRIGTSKVRRLPVALTLPANRAYFSTRPIQNASSDPSPRVLLREALRSSVVSVDNMAVDVIKAHPDKRDVASIVSYDQNYISDLVDILKDCDVRPMRTEPSPCSLLRAATRRYRAPRGSKVVVHLFLSDTEALGVLAVNKRPIVWRFVELAKGDEVAALISAARSLVAVGKHCGIESSLDAVMLHGRRDLGRLLDLDWMQGQLDASIQWTAGPALDAAEMARGAAIGALNENENAFDVTRSLKPQAKFWELFPWRQLSVQLLLLACLLIFLANRSISVQRSYREVLAQNTSHAWLQNMQSTELQSEKRDLTLRINAVKKFLDNRVTWTAYGRELAAALPDNVVLTSLEGVSELKSSSKRKANVKPKQSLVLQAAVSVPEGGFVPREIDRFLEALRSHPVIQEEFPVVELGTLKQVRKQNGRGEEALFTVLCLPKGQTGAR